jgi:lipopolysaccharide/colanic/teichoic acid biosynthesis glycosyltransferase
MNIGTHPGSYLREVVRTFGDRAGSALLLLLLMPVLIAVAVAVRITSPGPVLLRHERVGLHGRHFFLLQFRCITVGTEDPEDRLPPSRSDGPPLVSGPGPSVTRLGTVLGRYAVDALPQLLNVVKGEMSLVGPRAPHPSEVTPFDVDHQRRFAVKPGLIGPRPHSRRARIGSGPGLARNT